MRVLISSFGLLALSLAAVSCVAAADEPAAEERVGSAPSAEINPDVKYTIAQSGVTVGSAWAGTFGSSAVEYWVAKPRYLHSAARSITAVSSETCSDWKAEVCGAGWSGATYYRAMYTETTLNCAFPPGPCSPPTGAVSFLGSGSYRTLDASGAPFAWTYVASNCEYWSMDSTISTGTSTQSPLSPAYTSLTQFQTSVCGMSPVPSTWYSVYYVPDASFCSETTC